MNQDFTFNDKFKILILTENLEHWIKYGKHQQKDLLGPNSWQVDG